MVLAGAVTAPVPESKEINMQSIRIVAIPTEVAQEVRSTMRAPVYGFPAHKELATDVAPCRHCLRTFRVGQDYRILFTYDRFSGVESLPQPGPVYIHANTCATENLARLFSVSLLDPMWTIFRSTAPPPGVSRFVSSAAARKLLLNNGVPCEAAGFDKAASAQSSVLRGKDVGRQ